jgi:DNA-binding NtrC family response regulator
MDEFVAFSQNSQESLKMATLSSSLPVNSLIIGEKAVGKNHLAKVILPNAEVFEALELENLLSKNQIDLKITDEIIINNIQKITSTKNFLENISYHDIKIVATSTEYKEIYDDFFEVKIEVPPLRQRKEDVEFLTKSYMKEAKKLFLIDKDFEDLHIDLSNNAISLKKSIFRTVLFDSLKKDDIMEIFEEFLLKEFENTTSYKKLLPIFEIPLLKAGQKAFKSQLQMAKKFDINRNTLRKKLSENSIDG